MIFRHCGLVVKDIEKSILFYTQMLDFEVVNDNLETGVFIDDICGLKNTTVRTVKMALQGKVTLELLCFQSHPEPEQNRKITKLGYTHIALTVKDLDRVYDRLSINGLEFNSKPRVSPDGNAKVTFCRDPENNLLELVEELK